MRPSTELTSPCSRPVFEKKDAPQASPAGLDGLREACRQKIPVVALGGITLKNARACLDAGAAGIAAIRLFQENDIAEVVRHVERLARPFLAGLQDIHGFRETALARFFLFCSAD